MDLPGNDSSYDGEIVLIDKDSFCELIRLHEKAMYGLAISIVKNDADVAEIISETIFRAYGHLDTLKDVKSFKAWILRILHNTAVEYVRKNTRVIPLDEVEPITDNREERLETILTLRKAVESLKQPYRTVVMLYYYEDLSIAEIARITASTVTAVKKRLSRAREQLREILKEDF